MNSFRPICPLCPGFEEGQLGKTFAIASEANGIVAVIAGLVAQVSADYFGEIGPFRVAVLVTAIAAAFVFAWPENYGSPSKRGNKDASITRETDTGGLVANAYALGFCYSLFEGAMYTFVFLWYPTLEGVVPGGELPSGLVSSSFMLCIAIGGKLFDLVVGSKCLREELLLVLTTAPSAVALLIPTVCAFAVRL
ncbi:hypothetical protein BBJ28_00005176 [Nothophytophthora sp. Chile5]|nr:hypothetical protein BBJ28_00005176 [Nothophytophthora sp. Chile5]